MENRDELKERLEHTKFKINQLSKILLKKSLLRGGPVEYNTLTSSGLPVAELRMIKRNVKAQPKPHVPTSEETPPMPVKQGSKLDKLRQTNLMRILNKLETQQEEAIKKEPSHHQAKGKKPRVLPKISVPMSAFPNRYIRGELPCTIEHGVKGQYLSWVCPLENLDYEYYLPVFFDGIRVKEMPCSFLARQGIEDMLFAARGNPDRVIPVVKLIARPLKNALNLFDTDVLLAVLKSLQQLLDVDDSLGEHILKHAKIFFSPMALFLDRNKNIGDRIDYSQRKNDDIGEAVRTTLEMLEEKGGPDALKQIKFSIPVYQGRMKTATAGGDRTSMISA